MSKETTLLTILRALAGPLLTGWHTAFEPRESRRVALDYGIDFRGANTLVIIGSILYLGSLILFAASVTGVFGLTHVFEAVGLAEPGFSDRWPGLSHILNIMTAAWLALVTGAGSLEAAKMKLRRAECVIERKQQDLEEAVGSLVDCMRLDVKALILDEVQEHASRMVTESIYETLCAAEHFLSECLSSAEIAERLDVERAKTIQGDLRALIRRAQAKADQKQDGNE